MTLNELQEQLQNNLITYLSDWLPADLVDGACQVVVDTFDTAFFADKEKS
jgi:hypothetical protein